MYRKVFFLMFLFIFIFIPTVNAKTIIWVSMDWDADGDGANDSQEWVDKLEAEGYTIDFQPGHWDVLTQAKVNELNAADLVVMIQQKLYSGTLLLFHYYAVVHTYSGATAGIGSTSRVTYQVMETRVRLYFRQ